MYKYMKHADVDGYGVFTVTTAKMVVLGTGPITVSAEDKPQSCTDGACYGDCKHRVVLHQRA